ncbi:MAG: hypothetical protein A2Y10_04955 [Planctomycetes bacterium GWF2_41_51]|nr:MAG: hypothetical protein A2Y10_04955 [Planctomycetes bacterium GWF2_41_51]HBG25587.1 hypothetical protein [Phycisphaerales bacterium]
MKIKSKNLKLVSLCIVFCTVAQCFAYDCLDEYFVRCKTAPDSNLTSSGFTLVSGNNEALAKYDGYYLFDSSEKMMGRISMWGQAGGGIQQTQIRRLFDRSIPPFAASYVFEYDVYVDGAWTDAYNNRIEIYGARGSDLMFVYDIRGDGHVFNAKRASDGVWVQKLAQTQTRPAGWNHIEIDVMPAVGGGTLQMYINDVLHCTYSGMDAFGLPGDFGSQFVDRLVFLTIVQDQGPAYTNSVYVDNFSVYTTEDIPPQTLLTDGFESDFSKWTDAVTTDWDRATVQKYSGSYSAHAGSADNDLISDNLNTTGALSMTISFWYRDDDIDDDDNIYLQLYDGAAYDNKFELGNTSPEDTWHNYVVTIYNSGTDAQYFHPNFRLKFEGTSIDSGENLWIDDVSVTTIY